MTDHADVIREALHTLYAYTSDDANPPGEGRSWSHEQGRAALDALVAERDEAELLLGKTLNQDAMDALRRAEAAEAEVARLREALRQVKPLVTGQLPTPANYEMTMRCVHIANIIDAALAKEATNE